MAALLLLCFLAQAPPPPAAPEPPFARLEGRVTSVTGDPLRKATVRLEMALSAPTPSTEFPQRTNYTATSDSDGNFVFEDLEPATYSLSADRPGYVRALFGAKGPNLPSSRLTLSAGQKMTGVHLKMTPHATISGKVADEDGDSFPGAAVRIYRLTWIRNRRQLEPLNNVGAFPDGTFMLANLAPGKYYLSAADGQPRIPGTNMRERGARKGPMEEYLTTYYPNALDIAQAAPIELTPGIDVRGIEIRMRKTRVFRIAGRVLHSSGVSAQGAMLNLFPAGGFDFFALTRGNLAFIRDKDARFEYSSIRPGSYILQAQPGPSTRPTDGSAPQPMLGRLEITVGNQDIENVVMTLGPGTDVSGQFILDNVGTLTAEARKKLTGGRTGTDADRGQQPGFQLSPLDGSPIALRSQNKDDGTFLIKSVAPDRYRLVTTGLPPGCYAKQVRYGGVDVTRSFLDLTAAATGALEVVVSPNAATVSGIVRNEKGDPAKDVLVTIYQPADPQPGSQEFYRPLRTDDNGAFNLPDLAPGEYRVLAWEQVQPGLPSDADFRKPFESKAVVVKLQENSRENIEPKLLPLDAIEAEAAKIR